MFDFGKRLKDIRKINGLTQKQLAEKIGANERGVRSYELGKAKPGLEVILAILDNVDVSADYLLGRTDNPYPTNYNEKEVKEAFAFRDTWQKAIKSLPQIARQP